MATAKEPCMSAVSCIGNLEGIGSVIEMILSVVDDETSGLSINRVIPKSWLDFEKELKDLNGTITEKKRMPWMELLWMTMGMWKMEKPERKIPVLHVEKLNEIADKYQLNDAIGTVLNYLNDIGSILHFNLVEKSKHLVFLDPEWLFELLKLLFRHDHKKQLTFKAAFSDKLQYSKDTFDKDREQFLEHGLLSYKLLR